MADKNLLVNNLKHYFGIFETNMKQFFKDMFNTQHTQETIFKISDCLFKTNTKLSEFKMIFGTNYIVLGKLNATEHDHKMWNSLLIRYNKLMEMLGLGIRCTIKLIENLQPNGTCLMPEIYPDLLGLVDITSSYTMDMINTVTQDILYFQDNPISPWFDIKDPVDRPSPPQTLNTLQNTDTSHNTSDLLPTIETPTLTESEIQNIMVIEPKDDIHDSMDNEQIRSRTSIPIIIENNWPIQIKSETNNNSPNTPQDPPTIKSELDNSPPTLQITSTPVTHQDHPTIKVELDNTTINIKTETDLDSQSVEIETLYDPDMDTSDSSSDNETDSNYDSSDSDFSDFEDIEGDFLEARERAFENIWKHIPPRKHIDSFG